MNDTFKDGISNPVDSAEIADAFSELYPEIKKIAYAQLNKMQTSKTITATVLVNECYLKLQQKSQLKVISEKHFYCLVAQCMKHYLIDEIRGKKRSKRSAELKTNLVSQLIGDQNINIRLIEIVRSVDQLERINPQLAELINLHIFGGFTFDELSKILDASKRQLLRKWKIAKITLISLLEDTNDQH